MSEAHLYDLPLLLAILNVLKLAVPAEYASQACALTYAVTGDQLNLEQIQLSGPVLNLSGEGKVFIRIFPQKSITSKPLETRMGKGKGEVDHWVAMVKPGTVLYELGGVEEDIARQALARVAHKMPYRCRFIKRRHGL